jgi:hypothetical protein
MEQEQHNNKGNTTETEQVSATWKRGNANTAAGATEQQQQNSRQQNSTTNRRHNSRNNRATDNTANSVATQLHSSMKVQQEQRPVLEPGGTTVWLVQQEQLCNRTQQCNDYKQCNRCSSGTTSTAVQRYSNYCIHNNQQLQPVRRYGSATVWPCNRSATVQQLTAVQ